MDKEILSDIEDMQSTLEIANCVLFSGFFDEALELLEPLAKKYGDIPPLTLPCGQGNPDAIYPEFQDPFQQALYDCRFCPTEDVIPNPYPLGTLYYMYGDSLTQAGRIQDARSALRKALSWSPVSYSTREAYAETFRITGDFAAYLEQSIMLFNLAYSPETVAGAYRHVGFYFSEMGLYPAARACLRLSQMYDIYPAVEQDMDYIEKMGGGISREATLEEMERLASQYGFPMGPSQEIIDLAYSRGTQYFHQGKFELAKIFLKIAYDLTGGNDAAALLRQIEEGIDDPQTV